jgi:MYXO-CTERM domain-containing protein
MVRDPHRTSFSVVPVLIACLGCTGSPGELVGVRAALTVSAEQPLTLPGTPASIIAQNERPAVAVGGGVRLVIHRDFSEWGLYVQRFDAADGKPLDPARILITPSSDYQPARGKSTYVSVLFDGSRFVVVWETWLAQVCAVRIRPDGTVLDPAPLRVSERQAHQGNPVVAFDGTNYLIAWGDSANWASEQAGIVPVDIRGARLRASDGVLLNRFWICQSTGVQSQPAVAYDGTNFVATWQHEGGAIRGSRIRPSDGAVLDGVGVSLYPNPGEQGRPALAFDGTNHVMVWSEANAIRYGRFSPSLQPLDGTGVVLESGNPTSAPAIALDGKRALIGWYRASGADALELVTSKVEASDATVTAGTPALLTPAFLSPGLRTSFLLIERPDIVFDGNRFLTTWTSFRASPEDYDFRLIGEIQVTGVDGTTGAVGTSQPGALADSLQEWADAAFDGVHHLVVWQESGADGWAQVRASRINDRTRAIGDSILVAKSTSNHVFPRVAYGNGQYLVVWWDQGGDRLLAVRVRASDGAILDATPVVLPASPGPGWDHPRWGVASDRHDFLVGWVRDKTAYALRVRGSDGAIDLPPFTVSTAATVLRFPMVVHTGGGYLMAWAEGSPTFESETRRMVSTRISRDGMVSNPTGETVAEINNWVKGTAMAASADGALLAWGGGYPYAVWARRLRASNGTPVDSANLQVGPRLSTPSLTERIAAAFDGRSYVVAWTTAPINYQFDLNGIRVNVDGTLDGPEFTISAVPGAVTDMDPALSAAGPDRVLAIYDRLAPAPGYPARRAFVRWLGEGLPVDAGVVDAAPTPADAGAPAADATVAVDAGAGPDAAEVASAADAPVNPPDMAVSVPDSDGAVSPVDASSSDAMSHLDGAAGAQDRSSTDTEKADATTVPAKDARHDTASDAGGDDAGVDCSCDVGGPARAPGALAWLGVLLPVLLRRRRRSRRTSARLALLLANPRSGLKDLLEVPLEIHRPQR